MMTAQAVELYSAATAQNVLDALIHFTRLGPSRYFALELVSYENGHENVHPAIMVRLDEPGGKTTLADKSEILHCLDDNDRPVSIMLGKPTERAMQPARILLETG